MARIIYRTRGKTRLKIRWPSAQNCRSILGHGWSPAKGLWPWPLKKWSRRKPRGGRHGKQRAEMIQ